MITIRNLSHKTSCTLLMVAGMVLAGGSAQAQTATTIAAETGSSQVDEPVPENEPSQDTGLPSGEDTTAQPWTIGVSPLQQKHAEALYQEGNRDFTNGFFAAAATKYQAALQHWNHPGIHYNLALALISLDRPIEAYESVVAALGQGTDALHPDEYQRALDYRRVLRRQIAEVEVACDEPGAAVTLDGKPLFTGPGRASTMVLPGKHQLVASKPGYLVTSKVFKLAPAARTRVDLHLLAAYQSRTRGQRWPAWTHWAVTGLGLGTGAAAAAMHWQFRTEADRLSDSWRQHCTVRCMTYPDTRDTLRERLEWQRRIAYAGYATAGAFLTVGAVLASLNRPQAVETEVRRETVQISAGGPAGSAGISVRIPF